MPSAAAASELRAWSHEVRIFLQEGPDRVSHRHRAAVPVVQAITVRVDHNRVQVLVEPDPVIQQMRDLCWIDSVLRGRGPQVIAHRLSTAVA